MIQVFTEEECQNISNSFITDEQINKAKNLVINYLKTNNIILTDNKYLKDMVHKSSTRGAKKWHHDEISLINFIIIIKGAGTKVLIENEIQEIHQGYGYFVIGREGYTFLGLKPVLHCAPELDEDRLLLKIMLNGNYDVTDYAIGSTVCGYDSPEYKKRFGELEQILAKDLEIVNKLLV